VRVQIGVSPGAGANRNLAGASRFTGSKPEPQAALARPAQQAALAKQDALQTVTPRPRVNPLAVGEAMAPLLMVRDPTGRISSMHSSRKSCDVTEGN
jgi:hypothetical protein